jgi:hypothetical protein
MSSTINVVINEKVPDKLTDFQTTVKHIPLEAYTVYVSQDYTSTQRVFRDYILSTEPFQIELNPN